MHFFHERIYMTLWKFQIDIYNEALVGLICLTALNLLNGLDYVSLDSVHMFCIFIAQYIVFKFIEENNQMVDFQSSHRHFESQNLTSRMKFNYPLKHS